MTRSLAEHYRAHREAFELALEMGCTPKVAEELLACRAARERALEAERRLVAKMEAPLPLPVRLGSVEPEARDEPWMMRD